MGSELRTGPGRPALAITPKLLEKLEKLGASGVNQRWAAQALCMHVETFIIKRRENAEFSAAWDRGRAKFAEMVYKATPQVVKGLIKNATTSTKANPGGSVAAQSVFLEKVARKSDGEEIQGQVNLDELGDLGLPAQGVQSGPVEIHEVRLRRIRRAPTDKGRIEDDTAF